MIDSELKISSEKNIPYENFPVGSWLLPRALRPHIITFYNFARAADNIADTASIDPDEKNRQLDQFIEGITKTNPEYTLPQKSLQMAKSLKETNVSKKYCLDLLTAFKQDVTKNRYHDWQELINYCQLSAAPVGRYMIDLHGGFRDGTPNNYKASDALCAALQILNHLQDFREDFKLLNRVYLPIDMMKTHKVTMDHLTADKVSLALRACLDDMLDSIDILISEAKGFPSQLNNLRLGMESQIIINIAIQLSRKLRKSDLISTAVKISKLAYIKCFISGSFRILIRC
jgi:squalene synthase HpnC